MTIELTDQERRTVLYAMRFYVREMRDKATLAAGTSGGEAYERERNWLAGEVESVSRKFEEAGE